MTDHQSDFPVHLFYSYCHKDEQYRDTMDKSLSLLKKEGSLMSWHDQLILPGQEISKNVKKEMNKADIMVFLISQDFIASTECLNEWEYAKQIDAKKDKSFFRIPIILTDCAWKDLLGGDDIKALPKDGKAVAEFGDGHVAWQQVYEGIKVVIEQLKNNFTPKLEFVRNIERTDFLSQDHIKLQDIFVFLPLLSYSPQKKGNKTLEDRVTNQGQLLNKQRVLIHGEEMSGKTALGRHLFLFLSNNSNPVLHIDLAQTHGKPKDKIFHDAYTNQFNGDYSLWKKQTNKTLILDNLSPTSLDFVVFSKKLFDRIIVTLPSDVFHSFFRDEERLADFCVMEIEHLTHRQQENLIRKRLALSDQNKSVTDGFIDQVENRVNSIIIANKIVPRYPFYVLSILQTYEGYMPTNLSITSYGHCYQALILANLIKAGISRSDNDINTCFNFAESLAFRVYQNGGQPTMSSKDFDKFIERYRREFIISNAILNRLKSSDFGIITSDGVFKNSYMYYFFLGKFLSKDRGAHQDVIDKMCEESHVTSNHLTLLFIIHHTHDDGIINDILIRSMCTFDAIEPAKLNHDETINFKQIVANIRSDILSKNNVKEERGKERDARDIRDQKVGTDDISEQTGDANPVNDIYKILKNNEILGQVIRNKYGTMQKTKIGEIVEIVADSGLRLINAFLIDENEITNYAHYIKNKYDDSDISTIKRILYIFSFLWTMTNIEKIVSTINSPEIGEVVNDVVRQKSTPAYDLIGYFSRLDSATELTDKIREELKDLLKKHDDKFIKRVLSIRTQHYMNTHRNKAKVEQSVCSLLGIKYTPRDA